MYASVNYEAVEKLAKGLRASLTAAESREAEAKAERDAAIKLVGELREALAESGNALRQCQRTITLVEIEGLCGMQVSIKLGNAFVAAAAALARSEAAQPAQSLGDDLTTVVQEPAP